MSNPRHGVIGAQSLVLPCVMYLHARSAHTHTCAHRHRQRQTSHIMQAHADIRHKRSTERGVGRPCACVSGALRSAALHTASWARCGTAHTASWVRCGTASTLTYTGPTHRAAHGCHVKRMHDSARSVVVTCQSPVNVPYFRSHASKPC